MKLIAFAHRVIQFNSKCAVVNNWNAADKKDNHLQGDCLFCHGFFVGVSVNVPVGSGVRVSVGTIVGVGLGVSKAAS